MTDLSALAQRLEQAGPESQAELLREAWIALNPEPLMTGEPLAPERLAWAVEFREWLPRKERMQAMLDCGAYLSAAEMLVPEGYLWAITPKPAKQGERIEACVYQPGLGLDWWEASTPSLALAAACLRASIAGKESA